MTEEEIIKHFRLGPDSRVKFKGDPQQYWIKNISPDRKNVFVHINGAQTYRKSIKNIVQVDNKKLTETKGEDEIYYYYYDDLNKLEADLKNLFVDGKSILKVGKKHKDFRNKISWSYKKGSVANWVPKEGWGVIFAPPYKTRLGAEVTGTKFKNFSKKITDNEYYDMNKPKLDESGKMNGKLFSGNRGYAFILKNKNWVKVKVLDRDKKPPNQLTVELPDGTTDYISPLEIFQNKPLIKEMKLDIKEVIRETVKKLKKEKLKEGTWALDRAKIPGIIKEIEALKKKAYNIIGDDEFFDGLDSAISRAEYFMDEKSKKNDVPGHSNIKEKLNENKSCSCKHK